MKKILRRENGITLIALVITVILMLILAGVAISALTTDGNLFSKTQSAVEKYNNSIKEEEEYINYIRDSLIPLEAEFLNLPQSISLGCISNVIIKIPQNVIFTECKWIISKSKKLELDSNVWESANNFTKYNEEIELKPDEIGKIYIHVLLMNNVQKRVTSSKAIEVTKAYLSDVVNQNTSNEAPWVLYDISELTTTQSVTTVGATSTFTPANYKDGWRIFSIEGEGKDAVITLISDSVVGTLEINGPTGYSNAISGIELAASFYKTEQASATRSISGSKLTDDDLAILSSKNLLNIGSEYWVASVYRTNANNGENRGYIRYIDSNGALALKNAVWWYNNGSVRGSYSVLAGVRVLVTLKPGIEIYGGDGKTLNSAYKILDYTLLDKINPNDAIFNELTNTFISDSSGSAIITLEDSGNSGIDLSSSKWLFVQDEDLNINSSKWENAQTFDINNEKITLKGNVGEYYIYVLSVDNAGNKTLTKSEKITITQPKDNYFVDKVISENLVGKYVNYDVSKLINAETISITGDGVSFIPSEYTGKWKILSYEGQGSTGRVMLVSTDVVGSLSIIGSTGYHNAVTVLNDIASYYKNDLAIEARSLKGNDMSSSDLKDLINAGTLNIGSEYWIASVYRTNANNGQNRGYIRYINNSGALNLKNVVWWFNNGNVREEYTVTSNVRVVIVLKPQTLYLSGDGSENTPYEIGI